MIKSNHLLAIGLSMAASCVAASEASWRPRANCAIAERSHEGLHPKALQALVDIGIDHRITQTINPGLEASNYHGRDQTIDGKDLTAAVDISVRCLDKATIKQLLSELAGKGLAAWYRENGQDGWKGSPHIHAVLAQEPLKRQLRAQVASWLAGKTGLVGDARYGFWQATDQERHIVSALYEASKASAPK